MDPQGKVALITGGARIGQVVAQALAERGCGLAIIYRTSRDAAELTVAAAQKQASLRSQFRRTLPTKRKVSAAIAETQQKLGRLDILINMASTYVKTPNPSAKDWSLAMDSNATSAFLFCDFGGTRDEVRGGGRIINFTDWLAVSRRARYHDYVPYYASKAAVIGLTESLALDLAPDILVNAIAPGPILAPPDLAPAEHNRVIAATPLATMGRRRRDCEGSDIPNRNGFCHR